MTGNQLPDQTTGAPSDDTMPLEAAGVRIPRLGLGTFRTSPDEARDLVRRAVEVGYRHIDTALAYKNESGVGQGVRDSSVPRGEIFVTTKFPHMLAAPGDVVDAALTSVRALGLDYVDLLLMHWPNAEVPVGDTLRALAPLAAGGVVRALGQPRTVVIPKTARPERLAQNLDIWDFELDAEDVRRIDALGAARQRFFDPPWQPYAWDER
jgi:diketogulonate reductase-like aldo/keto reductase